MEDQDRSIRRRDQEIGNIVQSIQDLNTIFKELATMVSRFCRLVRSPLISSARITFNAYYCMHPEVCGAALDSPRSFVITLVYPSVCSDCRVDGSGAYP